MGKDINRVIRIPEGIEVEFNMPTVRVRLNGKEQIKKIPHSKKIKILKEGNEIKIIGKNPTRRETALAGTIAAHIKNTIKGISEGFTYQLEICNVHFPMNVKIEGNNLLIKNFLGEKKDRTASILSGVEATLKGNMIELKSSDKELVGQTSANIEKATRVRNRDRRVFQDGIYIIQKAGEMI